MAWRNVIKMLGGTIFASGAAVVDHVLSEQLFQIVEEEVFRLIDIFDAGYELPSRANALSSGTFWMPIERAEEPRCAIEYVISKMYSSGELFQRIGVKGMHFSGVEWWFQDVSDGEQPKTFHTDCDLQTEVDRDGVLTRKRRNPSIGSVLYLSREGGATVAFGQRRNISIGSAALCPRLPQELVVVHPRQNRLFMFDGDLFHAVMHPQHPAIMRGQRHIVIRNNTIKPAPLLLVTLLMNWWVDKPYSPVAIPKSILTTLELERCSRPETFRPSLKGTARSARSYHGCRKLRTRRNFFEDLNDWQAQKLPQTLGKFGHQRAVLLKYSRELSCEMKRDFRDCGPSIEGDASDWPQWNISKAENPS